MRGRAPARRACPARPLTTSSFGDEAAARYGYASALLGLAGSGDAAFALVGGPNSNADDFTYDQWFPDLYELGLGTPARMPLGIRMGSTAGSSPAVSCS